MARPRYLTRAFGCPERDPFSAQSVPRTQLSDVDPAAVTLTAYTDPTAPIMVNLTMHQRPDQLAAWRQFVANDLAGGALPFELPLWWFDREVTFRARLVAPYTWRRQSALHYVTQATVELERESIL